jgi:hypothetical protein
MSELTDEDIEAIHEAAEKAAQESSPYRPHVNPHPVGSIEADIWDFAYRQALAEDWH